MGVCNSKEKRENLNLENDKYKNIEKYLISFKIDQNIQ